MDKFVGKWEVTTTENMDEMLKACGMEDEKRKMYSSMKFVMEYNKTGDKAWQYTVHMPGGMSKNFNFTIGEEYDSTTLDGRPIVSLVKEGDGKFVEYHKDKADPSLDCEMVREIKGDELLVSAKVKGITSITRHKKA